MPRPCEWCQDGPECDVKATAKVTITNLEGELLDFVVLCDECLKRGVTWNGTAIDSHD